MFLFKTYRDIYIVTYSFTNYMCNSTVQLFFAEQFDAVQIHLNALNQVSYFKIICSNKLLNN